MLEIDRYFLRQLAVGMVLVTIGLTGKQYMLQQIQNVGSNMMVAEHEGGDVGGNASASDVLTLNDLQAVRGLVPGISASSPMVEFHDRITVRRQGARHPGAGRVMAVPLRPQPGRPRRPLL